MNQKFALLIAGVLTAFLLVIGGGLAGRLTQSASVPTPAMADAAAVAQVDPSSQVLAQMQAREAAYQQLIDQANQRLQQAYDQQKATAAQINQARSVPATRPAPRPAAAPVQPAGPTLSAETALNIAINATGKRMTREPQLVLYSGVVAYEIGFTNGAVYIDANTGAVLYNGTVGQGGGGGGGTPPPDNHEHDD